MRRPDNVVSVAGAAVQATAAAASSTTALPVKPDGERYPRVMLAVITATEVAVVRLRESGAGTVTAATGLPISKEQGYIILNVGGFSHLAHIRAGSTDVVFNIVPMED